MANPFNNDEEDEQKPAVDLGLSPQDKQAVGNYASNGVDYDKQARIAALNKFNDGAKDDPTLQNMLSGIAMGGVGSVENVAAKEAAPLFKNAANSLVDEASTPLWKNVRPEMQGSSPNASSATPQAINQLREYIDDIGKQFGFSHPKVQHAQAMLNRMRGLN